MKSNIACMLILLLTATGNTLFAQSGKFSKADQYYQDLAYWKAARLYEKGLKKSDNPEARANLADTYWNLGKYADAERHYALLVQNEKAKPEDYLAYARTLEANGKYQEAEKWIKSYVELDGDAEKAKPFMKTAEFAGRWQSNKDAYKIVKAPFNGSGKDIAPVIVGNNIVFASARKRGFFSSMFSLRDGAYFYDLYTVNPMMTGEKPKFFEGKINTKYHDGPASVSSDGKEIFFTRSNFTGGKLRKSKSGVNMLKIFYAIRIDDKWSMPVPLSFNSDEFSCAHPSINREADMLFFASDMPGGFGGTDIWVVKREENGWSAPENLGPEVNTPFDELFPVIHPTGKLFFSSNGKAGLGGLDIYSAEWRNAKWTNVRNYGYPLNTAGDDFAPAFLPEKPTGYFTSNREGSDQIYMFSRRMPVEITVVEEFTGDILADTKVRILDVNGKINEVTTDAEGKVHYFADYGKDFKIQVTKENYKDFEDRYSTLDLSPVDNMEIEVPLVKEYMFAVNVKNRNTNQNLEGATVRLIEMGIEHKYATDAKGNASTVLRPEMDYQVVVWKKGFIPEVFDFSTIAKEPGEPMTFNTMLRPGEAILVEGQTVKKNGGEPLMGVNVRAVYDTTVNEAANAVSKKHGKFFLILPAKENYFVFGSKEGYFSSRVEIPGLDSTMTDTNIVVPLELIEFEVGAMVKKIYYDYNKADLTISSQKELIEIAYFLKDNPEAVVELSAHTDCRGGDKYNQRLSEKRAKSAEAYIEKLGVPEERINSKGYGESMLVNLCACEKKGKECTDEEHRQNRRCEVTVTSLDGKEKTEEATKEPTE